MAIAFEVIVDSNGGDKNNKKKKIVRYLQFVAFSLVVIAIIAHIASPFKQSRVETMDDNDIFNMLESASKAALQEENSNSASGGNSGSGSGSGSGAVAVATGSSGSASTAALAQASTDPCLTGDSTIEGIHRAATASRDDMFALKGEIEQAEKDTNCQAIAGLSHAFSEKQNALNLIRDEVDKLPAPQQELASMCIENRLSGIEGQIEKSIITTLVQCSKSNPVVAQTEALVQSRVSDIQSLVTSLESKDCSGLNAAMKQFDQGIDAFETSYSNALQGLESSNADQIKLLSQYRDAHLSPEQSEFDRKWFELWHSKCEK